MRLEFHSAIAAAGQWFQTLPALAGAKAAKSTASSITLDVVPPTPQPSAERGDRKAARTKFDAWIAKLPKPTLALEVRSSKTTITLATIPAATTPSALDAADGK